MTAIRVPKGFERDEWALVWMNTAFDVARRSACVKAQCGAVVVTKDNLVVSVGYNGPPRGYPGTCVDDCPRAHDGATDSGYDACISIHAEANAIMHCARCDREGGTIYVTGVVCVNCAKLIANSGLSRVVMKVARGEMHRHPDRTIALLRASGLHVDVWGSGLPDYLHTFLQTYGGGPFDCHFCDKRMPWLEVVHHLDHDHDNNDPTNLVPAHTSCHSSHHGKRPTSEATKEKLRKPRPPRKDTCSCGLTTTLGRLKKHREETGH